MINEENFIELREKAKLILENEKPEVRSAINYEIEELIEELNTYKVELQLQSQELLKSNQEIILQKRRFESLYMDSPVAYFTINETGNIIEMNYEASELLQIPIHKAKYTSIFPYLTEDSKIKLHRFFKQTLESGIIEYDDIIFLNNNQEQIFTKIKALICSDCENDIQNVRFAVIDQSKIKEYEKELELAKKIAEIKSRYEILFNSSHSAIVITDANGYVVEHNESFAEMLKYNEMNLKGRFIHEFTHPDDIEKETSFFESFSFIEQNFRYEKRYIAQDGTIVWVDVTLSTIVENEKPQYYMGIINDITKQKIIKNELQENERKYRQLFENNLDAISIFGFGKDGNPDKFLDFNIQAAKMLGYEKDELIKINPFDLEIIDDFEKFQERVEKIMKDGEGRFETKIKHKNGSIISLDTLVKVIDYNNQKAVLNISRDITDSKKILKEISLNELKFKTIVQNIPDLIFHLDRDARFIDFYQDRDDLFFPTDEFMNKTVFDLFDKDFADKVLYHINQALKIGTSRLEHSFEFEKVSHHTIKFQKLNDDEVIALISDITEQKEAQQAIRESEEKFKAVINYSPFAILMTNQDGIIVDCNKSFEKLLHLSKDDLINKHIFDYHKAMLESDERNLAKFEDVKKSIQKLYNDPSDLPMTYISKVYIKGERKYLEQTIFKIETESGFLIASMSNDVTERIDFQKALEKSESFLKTTINAITHPFYVVNVDDYSIALANDVVGGDSIIGKKCHHISHTSDYVCSDIDHPCPIIKVLETKKPHITEHLHYDQNGNEFNVEVHAYPIFNENGEIKQVIEHNIDITDKKQILKELSESEEKYRLIADNASDVISVFNITQEKFTYISPSVFILRGYTAEEAINQSFEETYVFETVKNTKEKLKKRVDFLLENPKENEKKTFINELQQTCKDGSFVWTEITTRYRINKKNETESISIIRNINERKINQKIIENHLRYVENLGHYSNTLLQNDNDSINQSLKHILKAADCSRVYIFSNFTDEENRICTRRKYEACDIGVKSEMDNADLQNVIYDEHGFKRWKQLFMQNTIINEKVSDLSDEERIMLEAQDIKSLLAIPIYVNQKWYGFMGFDDTFKERNWMPEDMELLRTASELLGLYLENQDGKAQLEESYERFDLAIEGSYSGIFDWSIKTNKVYYSPRWKKLLGYQDDELPNEFSTFEKLLHPDDKQRAFEVLEKYLSAEISSYDLEVRMLHKSHGYRWIRIIATALRDSSGKPYRMSGSHTDITDRKEDELLIKKKNEELDKLNAEKDKFFSIIAHDLRSPLGAVMGLLNFINAEFHVLEKDELKDMLLNIDKTSTNVFRLLENLLEWSRLQRGLIPFEPVEHSLYNLVTEATIDLYNLAFKKEIYFKIEIGENIKVFADKSMLLGIIRNLASNAMKFTQKGGKVIISAQENEEVTELKFTDTGIGMSDSIKNNLFNIEVNTSRQGTDGESSSGLGLILCKEFIEKHNGEILIESTKDEGSVFTINFPKNK